MTAPLVDCDTLEYVKPISPAQGAVEVVHVAPAFVEVYSRPFDAAATIFSPLPLTLTLFQTCFGALGSLFQDWPLFQEMATVPSDATATISMPSLDMATPVQVELPEPGWLTQVNPLS